MPKRTKLVFDRNLDDTQKYNIYRDGNSGVTSASELIMEIAQPAAETTVKDVVGETLTPDTDYLVYTAGHQSIINDATNFPITVYVNGTEETAGFTVNYTKGLVTFDVALTVDDTVTMDYSYDAVEVLDDDGSQANVTFLGTMAEDVTAPDIPANPSLVADGANNKAVLGWDAVTDDNGDEFFYKVEAEDGAGNRSTLTAEVSATLKEGLAANPYILEESADGGTTWNVNSELATTSFEELDVDTTAPDPASDVSSNTVKGSTAGTADATLTWTNPATDNGTLSNAYRLKAQDAVGNVSSPTAEIAPVEVVSGLNNILIKRKVDDGSYPTFEDTTSEIVLDTTDFATESVVDSGLADDTVYNYAIFVTDNAGNVSTATTVQATVSDLTDPGTVTGLTAEEVTV